MLLALSRCICVSCSQGSFQSRSLLGDDDRTKTFSSEHHRDATDETDTPLTMVFVGRSVSTYHSRTAQLKRLADGGAVITGVRGTAA